MTRETDRGNQVESDLERGRSCYAQRQWAEAFAALQRAESRAPLAYPDLELLIWSAALLGNDAEFLAGLERQHRACVEASEPRRAARAAFWLGFHLLSLDAPARASGWLTRARRHVEEGAEECAERGYLLLPTIFERLGASDCEAAVTLAEQAVTIGEIHRDRDLVALARNLLARALLRLGRFEPGLALLDEVMLEVTSGELSPIATGIVYCNVIATCQQVQALDRAREWSTALASWCAEQPELVTFTGYCQLHRAEILQLEGAWPEAMAEVRAICEQTKRTGDPEVLGDACYQRAELLRLWGELEEAETAYRLASQSGRDPQPGLGLLRLLQGRRIEAASGIDRALSTTTVPWQRARLLPAFIEIMLAAGEVARARGAIDELEAMASSAGTEVVAAMAAHARGALRLAEGNPSGAIEPLRHAFLTWQKVGAPYIAARIRVLLGHAFQACGDHDGAQLELDAARQVFQQLAAAPDLNALDTAVSPEPRSERHGLSARELEVLRLLASGRTNKEIGGALHVSERTIDRHVSNIFAKLNVPTRTAATAFAYEKGLV